MKNRGEGLEAGDWGTNGCPAAGACQHRSLNLPCGSRKHANIGEEFFL